MHSLEPEIRQLRAEGQLEDDTAARAIALERGTVFSVFAELRLLMYAGVSLVTGGVGLLLARNLERIGPLAIVLGLAAAAGLCAVPALRARMRGEPLSTAADYLLLLAVLLLSADLGYAEHEFSLLGPLWSRHLLILAVAHAIVAYAFRSSLVLGASLSALVGWFGLADTVARVPFIDLPSSRIAGRALVCAAVIAAWRLAEAFRDRESEFLAVFDHFAINLAFWGALAWCNVDAWSLAGLLLVVVLAGVAITLALRTGREAFLVYGVVYAAFGVCLTVVPHLGGDRTSAGFVLLVVCAAAAALWTLRQQLRERRP